MENRFGIKDLFLFLLLSVLIIFVALAMKQFDRQWDEVKDTRQIAQEQTKELIAIRDLLESGRVSVGSGLPTSTTTQAAALDPKDPFYPVHLAEQKKDFARGDWLIECFPVHVPKLTPLLSSDLYATIVQARVLESLVYRNPNSLEYVPLLASSWDIKDNQKEWKAYVDERLKVALAQDEVLKEKDIPVEDKANDRAAYIARRMKEGRRVSDAAAEPACPPAMTVTFKLRDNVTFSDGEPMTADDVVFTYEWVMNPKVDAPRERSGFTLCKGVRKISNYEVAYDWKEPFFEAFATSAGALGVMPKHLYSKYEPQKFNETVGLLMGTGPYRLESPTEWRPGMPITLVRNERYWGPQATFKRIQYLEVENDAAEMTMFGNGEFDVFAAQPDQYKQMINDPKVIARTNFHRYYNMIGGYTYIAWNQSRVGKKTRFADPRVRQAMTMLVNRQGLIDTIFLGFGKVATGPFGTGSKQNDESIKPWPYDPARAKALLKECGFEDRNGDGVIEGPDGEPFRFKLVYPNKSAVYDRTALYFKDNLAKAGITLEPDPTEWNIMIKRLDNRDFDAMTLGWSGSVENDIFQMFHSSQMQDNGDNYMSYASPELDAAIDAARRTIDEPKRLEFWRQCHRILHEDQPYTFLTNRESLVFVDKRVQNVERSKISLNYVERDSMPLAWYVPRALQKHQ